MRLQAQVAMVQNLDKCIGCHTCSVTCKQVWTNRPGAEYMWWNNVETKPGIGYPKRWEDQERWRGGWSLDRRGRLALRGGGTLRKLFTIFAAPEQPSIDDFYEPWTYDYGHLTSAPAQDDHPVARPKSQLTGRDTALRWGSNWEGDLAGGPEQARQDPNLEAMEERVRLAYEQVFMFWLPRLCEHCLHPSCVASCPSGAMYKRTEDGVVLVDQERCRGWRHCVSGCPYKKVYFNHRTGKAEKCTFCYPRLEQGMPTICSETCVGRLRYLGLVLFDVDRVVEAASVRDERALLDAQLDIIADPSKPEVQAQARADGIPDDWIEAAVRSPVHALIKRFEVALPLHPEYRTLPMVWYLPPLSPVLHLTHAGEPSDDSDPNHVFHAIENLRIPIDYLASLFTAGDGDRVRRVLERLFAVRAMMRERQLGGTGFDVAASVGLSPDVLEELFELLAVARYTDRYVIPPAHRELADHLLETQGGCGLDFRGGPPVSPGEGYVTGGGEGEVLLPVESLVRKKDT